MPCRCGVRLLHTKQQQVTNISVVAVQHEVYSAVCMQMSNMQSSVLQKKYLWQPIWVTDLQASRCVLAEACKCNSCPQKASLWQRTTILQQLWLQKARAVLTSACLLPQYRPPPADAT
jgi:hypothetical protein